MFSLKNIEFRYGSGGRESAPDGVGGVFLDEQDFESGKLTAVIGPSGSGKTTLLSVLAGFLEPQIGADGHFTFAGEPVERSGHPSGRVSFVFQSPMLLGAANGLANGLQGRVAADERKDSGSLTVGKMSDAARKLNLLTARNPELLGKRSRFFSGGEAQRVAILRALWTDPEAILCDEPTSSLDEANARLALGALCEWSKTKHRPVIWVTHNLEQAAEFAQEYVFVSQGKLVKPDAAEQAMLASEGIADRLACLREISKRLAGETDSSAVSVDTTDQTMPVNVAPGRFAGWIARALSTDGLRATPIETKDRKALLPAGQAEILSAFEGGNVPLRTGFGKWLHSLRALWLLLWTYSRYGAALVLSVMTAQILAAFALGGLVGDYAERQLQDPSVARIVFERVISAGLTEAEVNELALTPGRIRELEQAIRDELGEDVSDEDLARVRIEGRRAVIGSSLAFADAEHPRCREGVTMETYALNRADPLLRLTRIATDDALRFVDIDALLAEADARATRPASETPAPAMGIVDARLLEGMVERCGFNLQSQPALASWNPGTGRFFEIEIVAAMVEHPPLYPGSAELIVFNHDYEDAFTQSDRSVDPFSVATAYFPLDGFAAATRILESSGYRLRDDSAAAVETLRDIAGAADTVPRTVVILSLAVAAVVIFIVLDATLEMNKRVIALFMAHGMKQRHMFMALFRHMMPALVIAILLAAAVTFALMRLAFLSGFFPVNPMAFWLTGAVQAILSILTTCALAAMAVLVFWWSRARDKLKTLLQE